MKTLMFLIFFLLLGAFFIISENNIQLNSIDNLRLFSDSYFFWLDGLTDNAKTVSGYVTGMQWLPEQ